MAEAAKRTKPRASGAADAKASGAEQRGHVCTVGFCPICLAVTAVPLRPDAAEHLVNAGRELLLAMSSILGTRAGDAEGTETAPTLTRIDIE
jgi:hypothetical protein